MRRWSLGAIAGSLTLIASLYLPWEQASAGPGTTPTQWLDASSIDGWSTAAGGPAGLSALLLAALLAGSQLRPALARRAPIGVCGLLVGYFALAAFVAARSNARYLDVAERGLGPVHFGVAYGAYLGIGGGAVALVATGALRRGELAGLRSVTRASAAALGLAVLVSFLLPWQRLDAFGATTSFPAFETPVAVFAAVAICAAVLRPTIVSSAAGALLVVATVSALVPGAAHAYGAWLGLGLGIALAAAVLVGRLRPPPAGPRPAREALAALAVAGLFLAALFLPWEEVCYPSRSGLGSYSGRCLTTNGWAAFLGSTAAILTGAAALVLLNPRRSAALAAELAAGTAALVATLGFQLTAVSEFHLGYGSFVGFAATALLLVVVAARLGRPSVERNRLGVRLVPIALSIGYLVALVVPWWNVLPLRLQVESLRLSWLTLAAALIGIHLLGSWLRRPADGAAGAARLIVLPVALLVLVGLDLIRFRSAGMTWGGGVAVGFGAALALIGLAEAHGGLEHVEVPGILRVDRL